MYKSEAGRYEFQRPGTGRLRYELIDNLCAVTHCGVQLMPNRWRTLLHLYSAATGTIPIGKLVGKTGRMKTTNETYRSHEGFNGFYFIISVGPFCNM